MSENHFLNMENHNICHSEQIHGPSSWHSVILTWHTVKCTRDVNNYVQETSSLKINDTVPHAGTSRPNKTLFSESS